MGKAALFRLLERSGLNRLLAFVSRYRILILRYHGVVDETATEGEWLTDGPLPRGELRRQLETLKRRYRIVSLDDAVAMVTGRAPSKPYSVVLTFDDGYRNHATVAYPLLREFDAPATMFLVTDFVDGRQPLWFDRLEVALARSEAEEIALDLEGLRRTLRLHTHAAKVATFQTLLRAFKRMDLTEVEPILRGIEDQTRVRLQDTWLRDDRTAPLTWDQVRDLGRGGVSFGSHTASHQILTVVSTARIRAELGSARQTMEKRLGSPDTLFAYPNGDLSEITERCVREDGYRCALTTRPGSVGPGDNPFALRRMATGRPRDPYKLLAELSGALPWYLSWRDRLRRRHRARAQGS